MILRISISTLRSASERISSSVLTLPSGVVARGFVVDDGRLGTFVGFLRFGGQSRLVYLPRLSLAPG